MAAWRSIVAIMEPQLTDEQCWALLEQLFPNGLCDPALVEALAPEGWERSPLVRIAHPTAEQRYEEALRFRDNLRSLMKVRAPEQAETLPAVSLEAIREEMRKEDESVNAIKDCADLVGQCLWDIFSSNHDVVTADGQRVHLGSFRGSAGFIADFRNKSDQRLEDLGILRMDYVQFYMGTELVRHRADVRPVYELIFRRMQRCGLDWRYAHPRLFLFNLRPLAEALRKDGAQGLDYDPTENYWREREEAAREAEVAEFQRGLDDDYRRSVENARSGPPPATVEAYRAVYGHWPAGWPPEVEAST